MSKIFIALLLSLFLLSCSDEGSSNSIDRNINGGEDRSIDLDGNGFSDSSDADGDGFVDGALIDADGDGLIDDRVRVSDDLSGN